MTSLTPPSSESTPSKLDDLIERASREIDEGLLPSCQLAVARDGQLVADVTLGARRRGEPLRDLLRHQGDRRRRDLAADERGPPRRRASRSARSSPSSRPTARTSSPSSRCSPTRRASRMRRSRCRRGSTAISASSGSASGASTGSRARQFEYHPTSAHWVLAEVVERISGTDYRRFVHERVLEPLGLRGRGSACPRTNRATSPTWSPVGEPPTPEEIEAALGISGIDVGEVTEAGAAQLQPTRRSCRRRAGRRWHRPRGRPGALVPGPAPQPRRSVGHRGPGRRHAARSAPGCPTR